MLTAEKVVEETQKDGTTKYFIRTRKFLGRTEDFESVDQEAFEKAHLKAYLKGNTQFRFRYSGTEDKRQPMFFPVMEAMYKQEISKEEAEAYKAKHRRKHDTTN